MKKNISLVITICFFLLGYNNAFCDPGEEPQHSVSSNFDIHKTDDTLVTSLTTLLLEKINTNERDAAFHRLNEQDQQVYLDVVKKVSSALIDQENSEIAIPLVNMALIKYPDSVDLRRYLATAQLASGKADQAKKTLVVAHPDITKNPEYYKLLAVVDIELRLFSDAELLYTRLLQQEPNNSDLYLGLAVAYHGQEKNTLAVYYYQQALKQAKQPWLSQAFVVQQINLMGYPLS